MGTRLQGTRLKMGGVIMKVRNKGGVTMKVRVDYVINNRWTYVGVDWLEKGQVNDDMNG